MSTQPGSSLDLLIDCLTRADVIVAGLYEACEEQKAALRDNDLQAIEESVKRVNKLLAELTAAEEERRRIQDTLDIELKLSPGGRLSDVIPHTSGAARETLETLLKKMRSKTELLKEVNKINAIMTRRALSINRLVLRAFNPVGELAYQGNGVIEQGTSIKKLINKTI